MPKPTTITISTSTDGNGTATGGGSYIVGNTITLTATANSGYEFDYWSVNESTASLSTSNPLTLTAKATMDGNDYKAHFKKIITYTVYYNANGGTASKSSDSGTYGTIVKTPTGSRDTSTSTNTGKGIFDANGGYGMGGVSTEEVSTKGTGTTSYTFDHGEDSDGSGEYAQGANYTIKKNDTLTAQYTKATSESFDSIITASPPDRSGYIFQGGGDGTTVQYAADTTITPDTLDKTLKACGVQLYTVTFKTGTGISKMYYTLDTSTNGTECPSSITVANKTAVSVYGVPEIGYTSYYTKDNPQCAVITQDSTLGVTGTPNSYTVTLTAGTGISKMYYRIGSSGSGIIYKLPFSASYGSEVQAYGEASDGYTSNYTSTSPLTGNMGTAAVTKTLTAAVKSYQVTLSKGTGVGTIYYRIGTSGSGVTYSSAFYAKYGATVQAYSTANTGYTPTNAEGNPMSGTMPAADTSKTLTASAIKYTLTLIKGVGVDKIYFQTGTMEMYEEYTSPLDYLTYNATVLAYATASNGYTSDTSYGNAKRITITASATETLTATANTYTITFDKQSGTGGTDTTTCTYGSKVSGNYITPPTRTGYSFVGYYTGTGGTGTRYFNTNGLQVEDGAEASNTTLYAYWTVNSYAIELTKGEGVSTIYYKVGSSGETKTYSSSFTAKHGETIYAGYTAQTGYTSTYPSESNSGTKTINAASISQTFTATKNTYKVTIKADPTTYGSVDKTEIANVPYGTKIYISGNTIYTTINGTKTTVTATPKSSTAEYNYKFKSWSITSTTTVTSNLEITASFIQETRSYTVTIVAGKGGSVDETSITVPYNTAYYTTDNILTVGTTTSTATAGTGYKFLSGSSTSGTVTSNITITANFKLLSNARVKVKIGSDGLDAHPGVKLSDGKWHKCTAYTKVGGIGKQINYDEE